MFLSSLQEPDLAWSDSFPDVVAHAASSTGATVQTLSDTRASLSLSPRLLSLVVTNWSEANSPAAERSISFPLLPIPPAEKILICISSAFLAHSSQKWHLLWRETTPPTLAWHHKTRRVRGLFLMFSWQFLSKGPGRYRCFSTSKLLG